MPAHTSALIPIEPLQRLLPSVAGASVPLTGFANAITRYGAEMVNGQGTNTDWFLQPG